MRRNWLSVTSLFALAMMMFLSACGGSSSSTSSSSSSSSSTGGLDASKKYTVSFWDAFPTGANKKTVDALVTQYEQLHPNVTVTVQAYDSYTTLKTKITAGIAAGKPPAIAQVYEEWATQYQQAGALLSLQPFISGKDGLSQSDLSDFYPVMLKDGQINGTQYMLPFNKSDVVLYYNVDALQKLGITPPTSIKELESDLTKVTKSDGSRWGLSYVPDVDGWSILYKALGGTDFVSSDGKTANFASSTNAPYAKQALGELAPLVKAGAIHIVKGFSWENDFDSQKSLFALSSIASYPFLKSAINGAFQFNEMPIPAGPAGQFTVMYGTNLALFSGLDNDTQAAAWSFMKFLTSAQANSAFVLGTGYMPTRQSVFSGTTLQDYYAKTPARKAGPQSLSFSFVASAVPAWDQCRNIISDAFVSASTGQSAVDAAFSKMTQSCNSALAQG